MNFLIFNNGLVTKQGMSGSDQRVYHWSQFFKKEGHRVTLIIPQVGYQRFKNFNYNLIVTADIDSSRLGYFLSYLWLTLKGLVITREIRNLKNSTVIYSSSDLIPDSLPALFLKFKNPQARLLCGLHLIAPNPFKGFIKIWQKGMILPDLRSLYYFFSQRFIIFFLKRKANLVLVSNNLDRDFLLKKGFLDSQVMVAYGGVDAKLIPQKKITKKYEAVWVGRLHAQKGVDDLFSIWEKITQKLPKAKLVIVGENDLFDYFTKQKFAKKLQNNIVFSGYLTGKSLFKVLKSSKLFLCPSYYESFGMVIAEAMAAGLPVIAYNLPIYKEIYKKGIRKVSIGDTDAFASSAMNLLTNEEERNKLAVEASLIGRCFNWEKTGQKIINYFKS